MENSSREGTGDGPPISAVLGGAYAHTSGPIYAAVAAVAPDIRPAHGNVMEHLDRRDGLRLTDLAAASGLAPQSVQALVDQLEALGYVDRRADPRDRRAKRIWRTAKARRASQAAADAAAAIDRRVRDALGQQRYDGLRAALREISALDLT